jgi:preprotein translocase subunit YajC
MFITPAFAQGAGPAAGGSFILQLLPFLMIFAIIYFLIIRPQQRRLKEHREMVEAIRRGDTVVTSGGLIGKVTKVDETELTIDIAENTRVRMIRSTVAEVRSKGEPVKE